MNNRDSDTSRVGLLCKAGFVALLTLAGFVMWEAAMAPEPASASTQTSAAQSAPFAGAGAILVRGRLGGEIMGYDIDQNGNEGLLSEAVTLGIDQYKVATETFDQTTGQIIKVLAEEELTQTDDFVTQGIFANHVGLDLFQHQGNKFLTVNPLSSNKFTGRWTPPIKSDYLMWEISVNQQTSNVAVLQVTFDGSPVSYLFGSNIAANTFGPQISLEPISADFQFPLIALDTKTNRVVLAQTGICANCTPHMASVNMTDGKMVETLGLGVGSVQGLAVDSATGIACTTTTIDQNVEFYDVANGTGFLVHLPGASSELQSGQDVEVDPIHHVFLVQQYTSTGNVNDPQPHIYVYDEKGNLLETVAGLQRIPISPVRIAINPKTRIGYVPVVFNEMVTELQSFTY